MAPADLPCDGDGACMICHSKPPVSESLTCTLCATPWHVPCLSRPPESMSSAATWQCPDCSPDTQDPSVTERYVTSGASAGLIAKIRAIESDGALTEEEKARKRQELLGGGAKVDNGDEENVGEDEEKKKRKKDSVLDLLDEKFNCSCCMQLPERPVTTPCGHNFCLKCFQKWVGQRKNTCVKCRAPIPSNMASNPRINSALVIAIRMAKTAKLQSSGRPAHVFHFMRNENRPDKAFTTERAKRTGKANACSGQIFVTIPPDHFGPITAEYDPKRNQGVLVGEMWEDRMECRQWGAHFPHVAGIAGQSDYGSQSVALSGGYVDDEDHGEWFLYTGSGGRDLSGNKRTNKDQSFDQKFEKLNEALRVSCRKGYPVRVVRSHKEKRSSYAPETGVRYDGVYRIEKCWRKVGTQGFKVCRYLFVRCDNEPAPWTSDEVGDRPRPLPIIKELKSATDITERKGSPAWDYDEKSGWKWVKSPPVSRRPVVVQDPSDRKRKTKAIKLAQNMSVKGKLLKEFSCPICREVMKSPLTTPCAHNFCKSCLLGAYGDLLFIKERTREGGRALRAQKIVNKCPCCPTDISEFLKNPQVNREMMDLIESLQVDIAKENAAEASEETSDVVDGSCEQESDDAGGKLSDDNTVLNGKITDDEVKGSDSPDLSKKENKHMKSNSDACDNEEAKQPEEHGSKAHHEVKSSLVKRKMVASKRKASAKKKQSAEGSYAQDTEESDLEEPMPRNLRSRTKA